MVIETILDKLGHSPRFQKNIVDWRTVPSRPARFACLPPDTHPELKKTLAQTGIDKLYLHQREATELAQQGQHLVIATPTASGKTLCYNIPVINSLLDAPSATALYIFPTKALSQDQLAGFQRLNQGFQKPLKALTYDGDTPAAARKIIRSSADVVVTNPYMMHAGIMPNHTRWIRFFQGLTYVVIDEMHTLTGILGSHFANVIRRLQRLCRNYGSDPTFIMSSATIANPADLGCALIGTPVMVVTDDGSPRGEKNFVFYNPPVVNAELGIRRSSLEEARRLAVLFAEARIQTIVFCRSRTAVEVMVKYLKDHFHRKGIDISRVRGYRGGYLPLLRRQIEKGLREGDIDVVVATNALELGIDIGSLDACILTGYPGTVASTLQQAGRSGRKASPSAAILVGRSNATDQYVLHNPEYVLEQAPEIGSIDPDNLIIRVNQLKCAAFELPFQEGEEFGGNGDTETILEYLEREAKILRKVKDRWYWMSRTFPAEHVSLNASDIDNFVVYDLDERTAIGEVDKPSAMSMIHPKAIYGLQGEQFIIEGLDYDNRRALARKVESDYYTEAEVESNIQVQHLDSTIDFGSYAIHLGEINVTKTATLFKKIRFYTRENIGAGPILLPSESMHTEAFFLTLHRETADELGIYEGGRSASFKGFAKLLHRVLPLYVRCDVGDIGVVSEIASNHFHEPTLIVYDGVPGGVGLSETAARIHREIIGALRSIVTDCSCNNGCPCCINVGSEEDVEPKAFALALADLILATKDSRGKDPLFYKRKNVFHKKPVSLEEEV